MIRSLSFLSPGNFPDDDPCRVPGRRRAAHPARSARPRGDPDRPRARSGCPRSGSARAGRRTWTRWARSEYLGGPDTVIVSPGNVQRPRLQPHARGLVSRLWYGAASLSSVRWAAQAGLNLLTGSIARPGHRAVRQRRPRHPAAVPRLRAEPLFAADLVGPSGQIAGRLAADAAVQEVSELRAWLRCGGRTSTGVGAEGILVAYLSW